MHRYGIECLYISVRERASFRCSPKRKYQNIDIFIIHFLRKLFSDLHFKSYSEYTMHTAYIVHERAAKIGNTMRYTHTKKKIIICKHKIPLVLWYLWRLLYLRSVTHILIEKKKLEISVSIVIMGSYHSDLNSGPLQNRAPIVYIFNFIICGWKKRSLEYPDENACV